MLGLCINKRDWRESYWNVLGIHPTPIEWVTWSELDGTLVFCWRGMTQA